MRCRVKSLLGFIYVAIKVSVAMVARGSLSQALVVCLLQVGLILTVEAGIFPLMSGWWIDVCAMVCALYTYLCYGTCALYMYL